MSAHIRKSIWGVIIPLCLVLIVGIALGNVYKVRAQEESEFSLQVTPSPLVTSVVPGEEREIELKIRNSGAETENLKVELRAFSVNEEGQVQLLNEQPKEVVDWVTFAEPTFSIRTGEWFTQRIRLEPPEEAGFSYNFAIIISRRDQNEPQAGQQAIRGSVAVFTLINVDRPGATRRFTVESFATEKRLYEFLPANFNFVIKNTGNTIVQPIGNIFIQRSSNSQPVDVLPLNDGGSYILPNTSRTLLVDWKKGFPLYQIQQDAAGAPSYSKLVWDWDSAQDFRFGRYVAKLVAVYNDGQRDVPLEAEVTFWVIPWKILLGLVLVVAVLVTGLTAIVRKLVKISKKHVLKQAQD